jgi:hypothetical protein
MNDENTHPDAAARTPPYISFSSFQTMIADFHETGIPPRVDRSILTRFAGGLASQLIMALKSLGLTDERNVPTELGSRLITAYGTDKYPEVLHDVLVGAYRFLQLDLKTATPSMFAESFKKGTNAKEDVLRKCRTFFLHAAQVANIEVGPRLQIAKAGRPTVHTGARRRPKASKPKVAEQVHTQHEPDKPSGSVASKLLDKFPEFDPAWPPEIQAKWFDGYGKLLAMGDKA